MKKNKSLSFLILLLLTFLVSALLITSSVFLFTNSYSEFCYFLLAKTGKLHKEIYFKEHILPLSKFNSFRTLFVFTTLLFLLLNGYIIKKRAFISSLFTKLFTGLKCIIINQLLFLKSLSSLSKFLLSIILLTQLIFFSFFAFSLPVSYDEAWTYLNFSSKSILTSVSYYPAPNNHIFFSILTNISCTLFQFWDAKMSMRLINIITSVALLYCFFKLLHKYFSASISILFLAVFIFSYPVALYCIQARGYEMVLLFSVISVYSTLCYQLSPSKKHSYMYLLSTILGCYTMPSFLYFFLSLQLFLLIYLLQKKEYKTFLTFMKLDFIGGLLVFILYFPIIFINGLSVITANKYVKGISFAQLKSGLYDHINATCNYLLGTTGGGITAVIIFILILFLFSCFNRKQSPRGIASGLIFILLILPPIIISLQRVIPFERTWIYLTIPIYFCLALVAEQVITYYPIIKNYRTAVLSIAVAGIIIFNIINFPKEYKVRYELDFQTAKLFSYLGKKEINTIAANDLWAADLLTYELFMRDKNKRVNLEAITSDKKLTADIVLLKKGKPATIININDYNFTAENDFVKLYFHK